MADWLWLSAFDAVGCYQHAWLNKAIDVAVHIDCEGCSDGTQCHWLSVVHWNWCSCRCWMTAHDAVTATDVADLCATDADYFECYQCSWFWVYWCTTEPQLSSSLENRGSPQVLKSLHLLSVISVVQLNKSPYQWGPGKWVSTVADSSTTNVADLDCYWFNWYFECYILRIWFECYWQLTVLLL